MIDGLSDSYHVTGEKAEGGNARSKERMERVNYNKTKGEMWNEQASNNKTTGNEKWEWMKYDKNMSNSGTKQTKRDKTVGESRTK